MINNRQNGRRGRGRNGVRPQGGGGGGGTGRPEQGNRIDNRARGNAAQLLEKYKALARDAQMASDRVMTEYYLQFADHYFRVLADSRARFDEQRRPRDDMPQGANFQDDYDAEDGDGDITDSFDDPRPDQRGYRSDQGQNGGQGNGQPNGQRGDDQRGDGQQGDAQRDRFDRDRPDRNRQDRGDRQDHPQAGAYAQDRGGDRGPRQDRGDRPDRNRGDRQDRPDRDGRGPRDDAQDRGQDRNQDRPDRGDQRGDQAQDRGYRTLRAAPTDRVTGGRDSGDRGLAQSLPAQTSGTQDEPLAVAPVQPSGPRDDGSSAETPRRPRTRRPAIDAAHGIPDRAEAAAEPVLPLPAVAVEADEAPAQPPRRGRPRTVRAAPAPAADDAEQIDRLALPPAFLSTPAAAAPAQPAADADASDDEAPRRRRVRRTRTETDDSGDVAA